MPTQWETAIIETLRETRSVLALCDQGRAGNVHAPEDPTIRNLCEEIGYGAVMDSAQRQWQEKDGKGCHTCGPCLITVQKTLEKIDKVLLVYDEWELTNR